MLADLMSIFSKFKENNPNVVTENYIPADGTYVCVDLDTMKISSVSNIKYNKKESKLEGIDDDKLLNKLCMYDYNSRLTSIQKPIDKKKKIHSNNYLSFFVKKDIVGKDLTGGIIDEYYKVLAKPEIKYQSVPNSLDLYLKVREEIGEPDEELIDKIHNWIMFNIFNTDDVLGIDMSKKEYLKIFFEYADDYDKTLKLYQKENKRYLTVNVFNSNKYNVSLDNQILGVPDNNFNLNPKKPYLMNNTRGMAIPYMLDIDKTIEQKELFDFLYNMACNGYVNVYFDSVNNMVYGFKASDMPNFNIFGHYVRVQKGKEVEILDYSVVSGNMERLSDTFRVKNVLGLDLENSVFKEHDYSPKYNKREFEQFINKAIYSNTLKTNYFTDASEVSITDAVLRRNLISTRSKIFDYIYKDINNGLYPTLYKVAHELIYSCLKQGFEVKACYMFNIAFSLKEMYEEGDISMEDKISNMRDELREKINNAETLSISNDDEYYFSVGQVVKYLIWLSNNNNKKQSLINPFISVSRDKQLKQKLNQLYRGYNFAINDNNRRFNNLYSMVKMYTPNDKVNTNMIIAGYLNSSLILEKKKIEEMSENVNE